MNGLPEGELKKPSAVVMIQWYSFFESSLTTLKLWQYLIMFLDHPRTDGEKVKDLLTLLGDNKTRQSLYVKLVFVVELLQPIHGLQELLESGEPLIHKMHHIVAIKLQSKTVKYSDDFTLFEAVSSVINMLPVPQAQLMKSEFRALGAWCIS